MNDINKIKNKLLVYYSKEELVDIILKAIEYIEETKCVFGTNLDMHYLLKLLKGEE